AGRAGGIRRVLPGRRRGAGPRCASGTFPGDREWCTGTVSDPSPPRRRPPPARFPSEVRERTVGRNRSGAVPAASAPRPPASSPRPAPPCPAALAPQPPGHLSPAPTRVELRLVIFARPAEATALYPGGKGTGKRRRP